MAVELVKVVALACLITTSCVSTPAPGIVATPQTEQDSPKYEYSYVVKDDYGGTQGHVQTRDGEYAAGKYYVHVPGGIDQKVDYFADDWGYHPLVEYKSLSRSGSSSTQFALGEKAVAALAKSQARMEQGKSLRIRASSPRPKPSVSIHSSSGIISNPTSHEQQVESTSVLPMPTPLLSFKSTSGVVNYPAKLYEDNENNVRTSTEKPVKITLSARYVNRNPPKFHTPYTTETAKLTTNSEENNSPTEDISIVNFESKKHVPYQEITKSSTESEDYLRNTLSSSTTESIESESSESRNDFLTHESNLKNENYTDLNSSVRNEDSIEITSYLADSNSAVDVTTKNTTDVPEKPEVLSSNAHTISAIFFAENDQKQEDNEIQSESSHISSTVSPKNNLSEFSFGPIIVPDYIRNQELSDFFYNSSKEEEKQEGSNLNVEEEAVSATGEDIGLKTTPRPLRTARPKLDSQELYSRGDTSSVASSNELLAPIQAGVSLSSAKTQSTNDAGHSKIVTGNEYSIDDDEPEIEKQVIQKEAVYKTTVDIQKSIPLEISAQNINTDQQFVSHVNEEEYKDLEKQRFGVANFNEVRQSDSPHGVTNNVLTSQQRVSGHSDLQLSVNDVHANPHQNIPQPTYVPGNVYYIYLHRYNPYINRYNVVPQPVVLQPYSFPINAINNQLYQSIPQLQPETYSLIPDGSKPNNLDTDIQQPILPTVEQNVDSPQSDKNPDAMPLDEFQKALGNSQTSFSQTDENRGSNVDTNPSESPDSSNNNYQHLTETNNENTPRSSQTIASTFAAQLNALTAARFNEIHSSDSQISEIKVDTTQGTKQTIQHANGENGEYFKQASGLEPNQYTNNVFKNYELHGVDQVTENSKIVSGENVVPTEPLPFEQPKVSLNKPFQNPIYVGLESNVPRAQSFIPGISGPIHSGKPGAFRQLYPPLPPASLRHAAKHPKQLLVPPHHTHIARVTIKQHPHQAAKARRGHQIQTEKSHQPPFIPSQKVFSSVYPPETYYVTQYLTRQDRSGGKSSRQLIVEYGGFKPPMVPSVQIDVEPTTPTNDQTQSKL